MKGTVYKIHSDFYYVMPDGKKGAHNLIECKLREILKKQKIKIAAGDFAEVEDSNAIVKVLTRKNHCAKPNVANLDLMLVVSAIMEPELNFVQLNRYLIFLKYHNIPALLCFSKDDLADEGGLNKIKERINKIYKPLGYDIIFTSSVSCDGLLELREYIKGKTIALMGQSGVGKSSLLNAMNPEFNLRTKSVSGRLKRGTHTTRHCEIMEFCDFKIIDTPGFSKLTFDFILPKDLGGLFDEIRALRDGCRYSDCLHTEENDSNGSSSGCNVIKNLCDIDISRYESYLEFLNEAKKYKEKITYEGVKTESTTKTHSNKEFAKISSKKRTHSRKRTKQNTKEALIESILGEEDD